jgi:hypothetical protein
MQHNIQDNICSNKNQLSTTEFFSAGIQGIILNGVLLCPFYRLLDILFGDTYQLKNIWPSSRLYIGKHRIVIIFFNLGLSLKIFSIQTFYMPISLCIFLFCTPFLNHFINSAFHFTSYVNSYPNKNHMDNSTWNYVNIGFPNINAPLKKACENLSNYFFVFYKASWVFWPISDAVNLR